MQKTSPQFTLEQFIEASTACESWPVWISGMKMFTEQSKPSVVVIIGISRLHKSLLKFGPVILEYESLLCSDDKVSDSVEAAGAVATNAHSLAVKLVESLRRLIWIAVAGAADVFRSQASKFRPEWTVSEWEIVSDVIANFPDFDSAPIVSRIRRERFKITRQGSEASGSSGGKPDDKSIEERAPIENKSTATAVEALLGEESKEILKIVIDSRSITTDDKMRKICGIDRRFLSYNSVKWSELLNVSDAAIRKTQFWKEDRQKAIEADGILRGG